MSKVGVFFYKPEQSGFYTPSPFLLFALPFSKTIYLLLLLRWKGMSGQREPFINSRFAYFRDRYTQYGESIPNVFLQISSWQIVSAAHLARFLNTSPYFSRISPRFDWIVGAFFSNVHEVNGVSSSSQNSTVYYVKTLKIYCKLLTETYSWYTKQ